MDEMTLTLSSPITEEQFDAITDVDFDNTDRIWFHTKHGKDVEFVKRKKGKWLFKERREPVYDLSGVKTWGIAYMCSECGFIHTVIEDFGQYAYCPNSNCGAEMEGKDGKQN